MPELLDDFADDRSHICGLAAVPPFAAEGEDLADDLGGAAACFEDLIETRGSAPVQIESGLAHVEERPVDHPGIASDPADGLPKAPRLRTQALAVLTVNRSTRAGGRFIQTTDAPVRSKHSGKRVRRWTA